MFSHITDAIPGSIVTGVICIALLIILKKIDEKTRPIIKFPIPADLIAVSLLPYSYISIESTLEGSGGEGCYMYKNI